MSITTYSELQQAIADWLERADLAARITDFKAARGTALVPSSDMRKTRCTGKNTANRRYLSSSPQGRDQRPQQIEAGLRSEAPRATATQLPQAGVWHLRRTI
jgi:hypothetical protein